MTIAPKIDSGKARAPKAAGSSFSLVIAVAAALIMHCPELSIPVSNPSPIPHRPLLDDASVDRLSMAVVSFSRIGNNGV